MFVCVSQSCDNIFINYLIFLRGFPLAFYPQNRTLAQNAEKNVINVVALSLFFAPILGINLNLLMLCAYFDGNRKS